MPEPKYREEDSKCERKMPSYIGEQWYVPKAPYRKSLIKRLEERLDSLDRNESVDRTNKTSSWHCKTCRANDTRGYLNYIDRVIQEENDEYREEINSIRLNRIEQKDYEKIKLYQEREHQRQQRQQQIFDKAYPTFEDKAKFIYMVNRLSSTNVDFKRRFFGHKLS